MSVRNISWSQWATFNTCLAAVVLAYVFAPLSVAVVSAIVSSIVSFLLQSPVSATPTDGGDK